VYPVPVLLPAALFLVMNKTPPRGPIPIPETPVHTSSMTTDRFDPKFEDRDKVTIRLFEEMCPYFVGPMPTNEFLEHFLPEDSPNPSSGIFKPGMFSRLKNAATEADMFTAFVRPNAHLSPLLETDSLVPNCFPTSLGPGPGRYIPPERQGALLEVPFPMSARLLCV
jgi:hypothetical protein